MVTPNESEPPRVVGRYMLFDEIASGGMATVRYGRLIGEVGFSRTVAIKCLHPHFAKDEEFVRMFLDEAHLAARVRHPNVVPILDVVARDGELFLVMEFIQGESLAKLVRIARAQKSMIPLRIIASIMTGVLDGLHAAHEAKSEQGEPLGIVHRDVSPQNVIVGVDGVPRVLDFGVAKAAGRMQATRDGQLKGKIAYMAPEQLKSEWVDRRTDVYAASVVLWETLTGTRLFKAENEIGVFGLVLQGKVEPPSSVLPGIPQGYDEVTMRGLHIDPNQRFATAREMATALEKVGGVASPRDVGAWVEQLAADTLKKRADTITALERVSTQSIQAALARQAELAGGVASSREGASGLPPARGRLSTHGSLRPPSSEFTMVPMAAPGSWSSEALAQMSNTSQNSGALFTALNGPGLLAPEPISSLSQNTNLAMANSSSRTLSKPRVLVALFAGTLFACLIVVGGGVLMARVFQSRNHEPLPAASVTIATSNEADASILTDGSAEDDAGSMGAAGLGDAMDTESGATSMVKQLDAEPDAAPEAAASTPKTSSAGGKSGPKVSTTGQPAATSTAASTATATAAATQPQPTTTKLDPAPPRPPGCNPWWTVDAEGRRVPKPECL